MRVPRIPKLFIPKTFKNDKNVTLVPTHDLLITLGFLRTPKPGLNNWLPPGLLMLNKLKNIISKNLNNIGCEEVSLLILAPSDNWIKTGRWNGTELFKLKDSNNHDYCLSPTSEEEITNVVKSQINSYKDLPITYYQIHEKFRDEIRPRMGLLRSREFLMKDAYSFDIDQESAMITYNNMVEAYHLIFKELNINYVKADADLGDIGGDLSHEWHIESEVGEDTLFKCNGCGTISNIEKTISLPASKELIADNSFQYFQNGDKFLKVIYPKDRELEFNLLKSHYPNAVSVPTTEVLSSNAKVELVYDIRCDVKGLPLVSAKEGDHCGSCSHPITSTRAIEIGHTFYLGTKYSEPLDLQVSIPVDGKQELRNVVMGCYGIGISRIIAALGDMKDDKGFKWPVSIAPWTVTVITPSTINDESIVSEVVDGIEDFRWDDRDIGIGAKFKQSNLLGIPITMVIGKQLPMVEIETRWPVEFEGGNGKWIVHKDNVVEFLKNLKNSM